jgi:transcriptional regulator with XRE-family HTH domain
MQVDTERLRRLRLEAGLSLRALALSAGVSHDTVMEIEAGRRAPHPSTVKKLADALDVRVTELVDWVSEGERGKTPAAAA